ncbi:MAG: hypothetical protein HY319_14050 [Armatimonadetes bacterium]|nr:hypothetical protein [Armatimonadota bacterium]
MAINVCCESCGNPLPVEDINLERLLARCKTCNRLFDCSSQLPSSAEPGWCGPSPSRPEMPRPGSITLVPWGNQLVMQRRWFTPAILGLLFFCIAWDSFLVFWYSIALTQDDVPWIMIVFPIGHLAVGVGLTYTVLCGFFNKTEIRVDSGSLQVRHAPLPWPGQVSVPSRDLDQLFAVEKIGSKGSRSYELCALLKDGRRVKLLDNASSSDEALYIEQQVEKHLHIADRRMPGEISS